MQEIIFRKKKYLQLPEDISNSEKNTKNAKKLSFHFCTNGRFKINSNDWPNLEYIEIIGSKYFEFSMNYDIPSKIKEIYFVNTEYVNIMDVIGDFPEFQTWKFENSKFIKFKGQFSGNNHLNTLYFSNVERSELFGADTNLPFLENLLFLEGCNFFKVNLSQLQAPKLERVWFKNSNYLNIISLGTAEGQLKSFKFEKCAYPKLNVDFSKLSRLIPTEKKDLSKILNVSEGNLHFRTVKQVAPQKESKNSMPISNSEKDFYKSAKSEEDALNSANQFLKSQKGKSFKYCPTCGTENPKDATFCSSCGLKFRKV
ncbi:MAG: zinc ribbon domain-containing protein [Promethearchaeota archaeon]